MHGARYFSLGSAPWPPASFGHAGFLTLSYSLWWQLPLKGLGQRRRLRLRSALHPLGGLPNISTTAFQLIPSGSPIGQRVLVVLTWDDVDVNKSFWHVLERQSFLCSSTAQTVSLVGVLPRLSVRIGLFLE